MIPSSKERPNIPQSQIFRCRSFHVRWILKQKARRIHRSSNHQYNVTAVLLLYPFSTSASPLPLTSISLPFTLLSPLHPCLRLAHPPPPFPLSITLPLSLSSDPTILFTILSTQNPLPQEPDPLSAPLPQAPHKIAPHPPPKQTRERVRINATPAQPSPAIFNSPYHPHATLIPRSPQQRLPITAAFLYPIAAGRQTPVSFFLSHFLSFFLPFISATSFILSLDGRSEILLWPRRKKKEEEE